MKRTVLVLISAFIFVTGYSQTFEGTVEWKVTLDNGTTASQKSPKKKPARTSSKKEKNEKKEKSELELFAEMFSESGANGYYPTAIVAKFKGASYSSVVEGGFLSNIIRMYNAEKDTTYMIMPRFREYSPKKGHGLDSAGTRFDPESTVTKTSETKRIARYKCVKYVINNSSWWVTTEINDIGIEPYLTCAWVENFPAAQIPGIPLMVEQGGKTKVTYEVTRIKRERLPISDFNPPPGFTNHKK